MYVVGSIQGDLEIPQYEWHYRSISNLNSWVTYLYHSVNFKVAKTLAAARTVTFISSYAVDGLFTSKYIFKYYIPTYTCKH